MVSASPDLENHAAQALPTEKNNRALDATLYPSSPISSDVDSDKTMETAEENIGPKELFYTEDSDSDHYVWENAAADPIPDDPDEMELLRIAGMNNYYALLQPLSR